MSERILAKEEELKEAIKRFEAYAPSLYSQAELVEIIATAKEQYTLCLMMEGALRKILTIAEDALNKGE